MISEFIDSGYIGKDNRIYQINRFYCSIMNEFIG